MGRWKVVRFLVWMWGSVIGAAVWVFNVLATEEQEQALAAWLLSGPLPYAIFSLIVLTALAIFCGLVVAAWTFTKKRWIDS